MIYLPYSTEIFIFLQLLGYTHASWWWIAFFLVNDAVCIAGCRTLEKK